MAVAALLVISALLYSVFVNFGFTGHKGSQRKICAFQNLPLNDKMHEVHKNLLATGDSIIDLNSVAQFDSVWIFTPYMGPEKLIARFGCVIEGFGVIENDDVTLLFVFFNGDDVSYSYVNRVIDFTRVRRKSYISKEAIFYFRRHEENGTVWLSLTGEVKQ